MLPWLLCVVLLMIALASFARLRLLQNSLDDIGRQLGERLSSDTNNPIFLSSRDLHALKLAAELNVQLKELRRQRQQYENGDRELKEAVTNVSHDLRTPLTAICGYLDLLEREETSPDAARYLDLVRDRTDHLRQLTEEFFQYAVALSARSGGSPEAVSLGPALEESLEPLRQLISRERPRLSAGLTALGCRVCPGEANYLLFFQGIPALPQKLAQRGVLIRDCSNYHGLGHGWYRAAVRTEAENGEFLKIMKEVL